MREIIKKNKALIIIGLSIILSILTGKAIITEKEAAATKAAVGVIIDGIEASDNNNFEVPAQ